MYSFFGATPDSLDRQAVAARPRVAERPVAGDARRQFLQSLVGRAQLPAPSVQRLRGLGRARRRRLPVLRQDQAADRQPARGQPHRHPRVAVGVPAYEAITMGHPERMGLAHGWSEERVHRRSRARRTPHGTPYQNLCIGCDRFHEEVLGPVLEARARAAARRDGHAAVDAAREIVALMPHGPDAVRSHCWPRSSRVAVAAASARRKPDVERHAREGRGPDRQLERVGRRREDQRVHRRGSAQESSGATASRSSTSSSRTRPRR